MRSRLSLILICAMTALAGGATPAFAAHHGDHTSTTTTTTTTRARSHAKTHHHAKSKSASTTRSASTKTTAGGSASTAVAKQVLKECTSTGQITRHFTRAELKKALTIMTASTSQYSNCSDAIHTALAHGITSADSTGSGGSGSSTTTIVIIVVVVLLLAAIFGGLAVRRRRGGGGSGGDGVSAPSSS